MGEQHSALGTAPQYKIGGCGKDGLGSDLLTTDEQRAWEENEAIRQALGNLVTSSESAELVRRAMVAVVAHPEQICLPPFEVEDMLSKVHYALAVARGEKQRGEEVANDLWSIDAQRALDANDNAMALLCQAASCLITVALRAHRGQHFERSAYSAGHLALRAIARAAGLTHPDTLLEIQRQMDETRAVVKPGW